MLFLFVVFFAGTLLGTEGWCAFDQCEQDMRKGGTPSPFFEVIVRLPAEGDRLTSVRLTDWPDYHAKHPDSTLTLQAPAGGTDTEWRYTIMSSDGERQRVHAEFVDDLAIKVDYETRGETVTPLYSKATNVGYMLSAMPAGFFLAWLVRRLSIIGLRRWRPAWIKPPRQTAWNMPLGPFLARLVRRMIAAAHRRWRVR
jgi:hypothetical protein